MTDHLTWYAQVYITPSQTAAVVSKTLWNNFLVYYRFWKKILMDQERNFESKFVAKLSQLAQV